MDGQTRPLRPEQVLADGSARFSCVGGPMNRGKMRVYPPYTDDVVFDTGRYVLRQGTGRKSAKDQFFYMEDFNRKETP